MNRMLIEKHNAKVKKGEHFYLLGDFCFRGTRQASEICKALNGYKIIVKGNHDPAAHKLLEIGFDEVRENELIRIGNTQVLTSHFPYHPIEQFYKNEAGVQVVMDENVDNRYLHKRILDDGKTILLHGHVHTAWKIKDRMINVGVDVWDYAPVSHQKLLAVIEGMKK